MGKDKVIRKNRLKTLDFIRGFFTIYIVLHHLSLFQYHKVFFFITGQGQFVVVLFLVLSGISQELSFSKTSEHTFKKFLIKRIKRIYPLFLTSLCLSYILVSWKLGNWEFINWQSLIGHLFNIQDLDNRYPGIWINTFYNNTPLWYVSYVWWSYWLFFLTKIKIKNQLAFAVGISIFGVISFHIYPNPISHIISYFLIFWSGVEITKTYKIHKDISFKMLKPLFYGLSFLVIIEFIPVLFYIDSLNFSYYPVIEFRHYIYTLIGLTLGIFWIKKGKVGLNFLKKFAPVAPISYALFLFHYPLMISQNPFELGNIWINYFCGFITALFLSHILTSFFKKNIP